METVAAASLAGFDQLASMPGILRSLLAGVSEADAYWKPSPTRWSIAEVLGHLSHVEAHGFRYRAERLLCEANPVLDNYDPDEYVAAGAYEQPSLAAALDAFARERERSLDLLRSLKPGAAARTGIHAELGSLTLGDMLHEWPFHDLGHLRQIAELLRAVRYYPHLGPWQRFYHVRP